MVNLKKLNIFNFLWFRSILILLLAIVSLKEKRIFYWLRIELNMFGIIEHIKIDKKVVKMDIRKPIYYKMNYLFICDI